MKNKKKNPWIKRAIITTITLIVIFIIIKSMGSDEEIKVTTTSPEVSTITETIPANGKIQPITEVKISPDVSGEIVELRFEEGDYIKKGDLIIKIKQDVYISLLERATAALNSAKAQHLQQKARLRQAKLTYKRNQKLYDQKAIAQAEFQQHHSDYVISEQELKSAQYNIESASASLKEAQENLFKTTIYAPMSGIISVLSVEQGERVVGTSQMEGTQMLKIADFDEMEVVVDVNENDIIRISQQDTVEIDVDAYPGRKFQGIVTHIANSAKNIGSSIEQITNFEVRIMILPSSYQDLRTKYAIPFRPGMSASVLIQTDIRKGILTIPLQCITTRSDLNSKGDEKTAEYSEYIFLLDEETSTVKPVQITTGIQDINNIEVTEGLKKEDLIILGPYNTINKTLKEGSIVELEEEKEGKEGKEDEEDKEDEEGKEDEDLKDE